MQLERPTFFEGQILAANDLDLSVETARARAARHDRYLHTWGIAHGLELKGKKKKSAAGEEYEDITLSAGVAIDGTGREIVVAEDELLGPSDFERFNVTAGAAADAWFPVFLSGRDEAASTPPLSVGSCAPGGVARTVEGHDVEFGRPGDALEQDTQPLPEVIDGPGNGAWRVLIGFVQWNRSLRRFTAHADEADGVRARYAGVRADEVAARAGRLELRTRGRTGSSGKPAVVISETDGGLLDFGMQNAAGVVDWVMRVNAKGDLTVKGSLKGSVQPGSVHVESGVVSDGATLPLPPGITEEQVSGGSVKLHVHLSPRFPGTAAPGNNELVVPLECKLEAGTRRVLCRFRRYPGAFAGSTDEPGACNYIVIASVPAAGGAP